LARGAPYFSRVLFSRPRGARGSEVGTRDTLFIRLFVLPRWAGGPGTGRLVATPMGVPGTGQRGLRFTQRPRGQRRAERDACLVSFTWGATVGLFVTADLASLGEHNQQRRTRSGLGSYGCAGRASSRLGVAPSFAFFFEGLNVRFFFCVVPAILLGRPRKRGRASAGVAVSQGAGYKYRWTFDFEGACWGRHQRLFLVKTGRFFPSFWTPTEGFFWGGDGGFWGGGTCGKGRDGANGTGKKPGGRGGLGKQATGTAGFHLFCPTHQGAASRLGQFRVVLRLLGRIFYPGGGRSSL